MAANKLDPILLNGITASRANELFGNDLKKNERSLKKLLSGTGVSTIPQNAFDSLISFQNQTGDASYAYVKGEKIDLTSMYKNGEWDRAASFIAADERDRPRRIQEAAMMANNDYGKIATEEKVVENGLKQIKEQIAKGQLNKQTGNPMTPQQVLAAGSGYFKQTGESLPVLSFATNSIIQSNVITGDISQVIAIQQPPWPY